jgi:hypothetical protein
VSQRKRFYASYAATAYVTRNSGEAYYSVSSGSTEVLPSDQCDQCAIDQTNASGGLTRNPEIRLR